MKNPGSIFRNPSGFASSCVVALLVCSGHSRAEVTNSLCGPLYTNHYGPFDYRTDQGRLPIVEQYHFTPAVEALIRGSSSYLGEDLNYTLKAFPNHHRALVSVMKLGETTKSLQPPHLEFTVECYFERALRFRPDDTVARSLYAQYLTKLKRKSDAMAQLQIAAEKAGDNAFSHFNIGLLYFDLDEFDLAASEARKAKSLGLPRTELEERLTAKGKWRPDE